MSYFIDYIATKHIPIANIYQFHLHLEEFTDVYPHVFNDPVRGTQCISVPEMYYCPHFMDNKTGTQKF